MKKFFKKIKKSKGFALLFAVLTASLLLSIGLSIFSLTIKEISLSSYSRESQFSFYAADSGAECALYWDLKGNSTTNGTFATSSTYGGVVPYQITCGNQTVALTIVTPPLGPAPTATAASTTFNMLLNDTGGSQIYCAVVTVAKSPNALSPNLSDTIIDSRGYNVCNSSGVPIWGNPNLVERALDVYY